MSAYVLSHDMQEPMRSNDLGWDEYVERIFIKVSLKNFIHYFPVMAHSQKQAVLL